MKLYYSKGACSLVVRIVIHELELACEFESVDLKTKKTESGKDFFKINPKGSVPVLTMEHQVLTENAVIIQYLADQHTKSPLLPAQGFQRYKTLEWVNYITTEVHKSFSPLFNPHIQAEMKETIFKPFIQNKFDYINQHLENKRWLMGEAYTLADAYLFVMISWLKVFSLSLENWPNLLAYYQGLKERPAIQLSLEEEGLR